MATRNLATRMWTPAASALRRHPGPGTPPPLRSRLVDTVHTQDACRGTAARPVGDLDSGRSINHAVPSCDQTNLCSQANSPPPPHTTRQAEHQRSGIPKSAADDVSLSEEMYKVGMALREHSVELDKIHAEMRCIMKRCVAAVVGLPLLAWVLKTY